MGVVLGTVFGVRLLGRIPEDRFRKVLGGLIFLLGAFLVIKAGFGTAGGD